MIRSLKTTLEMIKIEHTLFALPFAFLGAVLAARGLPTLHQVVWITVAMVGARSAAMAFNRLTDREIDAANPRTQTRALPDGIAERAFRLTLYGRFSSGLFLAAFQLNRLTLLLSPIALASVLAYSYTKRSPPLRIWCSAGVWPSRRRAPGSPCAARLIRQCRCC